MDFVLLRYAVLGVLLALVALVVVRVNPNRLIAAVSGTSPLVSTRAHTPTSTSAIPRSGAPPGHSIRLLTLNMWCHYFVSAPDKGERVRKFVQLLGAYDVVLVQEMFTVSVLGFEVAGWKEFVKEAAAREGLQYSCESPAPLLFGQDSGLLILSRFPILESNAFVYRSYTVLWEVINAKGALHATIDVSSSMRGSGSSEESPRALLHIFNTHLDAKPHTAVEQLGELRPFIARHVQSIDRDTAGEKNMGVIVAGDLNVDYHTRTYEEMRMELDMLDDAFRGFRRNTWQNECLDYVLTTPPSIVVPSSHRVIQTEGSISDHQGLSVDLYA